MYKSQRVCFHLLFSVLLARRPEDSPGEQLVVPIVKQWTHSATTNFTASFACFAQIAGRNNSPNDASLYSKGSVCTNDDTESVSSFVAGNNSAGSVTLGVSVMDFEQHCLLIRQVASPSCLRTSFCGSFIAKYDCYCNCVHLKARHWLLNDSGVCAGTPTACRTSADFAAT